ncbi:hypothetical protein DY000_02008248 [Brassica cretica]|uniref:RNase H type-1 domain-containing protein n=1 Tax=Brassica cretica TaxID=69181 RepID=A0ABQ7BVV1_BRACR|nr:hypothetical protein DY000_02008248 [Brassica cretica]
MYERQEANLDLIRDGLLGTSGHYYKPSGLTNIRDRDRSVPERLQEDFEDMNLSHIPRSRNGRADVLAKEAMTRCYIFFHIDRTRLDGGAPRRIGSSDHHLI